jgi:hypothetical protein
MVSLRCGNPRGILRPRRRSITSHPLLSPRSTPYNQGLTHISAPSTDTQPSQNKDASFTYVHMQRSRDVDVFEDFAKEKLPADEILVAPQHRPINPEDEDDVVPDQHAAFGIQKATQRTRESAWKDLGLAELMKKGPGPGVGRGAASAAAKGGGIKKA